MSVDPFAGLLDPFAWWDLPATYQRYASFFDLAIYCTLFVALVHAVLGGRFPGRPGKAISTVLGIAMGIGLTIMTQRVGWSLAQVGPYAALFLLLISGFLLLHFLLRLNVPWSLAVPVTYVLLYFLLKGMAPQITEFLIQKAPFLNLLTVLILLIAVWQIVALLWPKEKGSDSEASFIAGLDRDREKKELGVIKNLRRRFVPQAERQTRRDLRSLDHIKQELRRPTPDWQAMSQAAQQIIQNEKGTMSKVERIRLLDKRLRNFDWQQLQQLRHYCADLSEADRQRLQTQIQRERDKIVQEHRIEHLAENVERRLSESEQLLSALGAAAQQQLRGRCQAAVTQAMNLQTGQKTDLQELAKAEKRLYALTRRKLREENQ